MSWFTKQGTNLVSLLADLGQAPFALCASLVEWWTCTWHRSLVPGTVSVFLLRWSVIMCLNCFFNAWHEQAGSSCHGKVLSEGVGAGVYLWFQGWSVAGALLLSAGLARCCPHLNSPPHSVRAASEVLTAACHWWPLLGNVIWVSASRLGALLS